MRRRQEPSGSQPEPQDTERMAGSPGAGSDVQGSTGSTTGATSTGMQDTRGTTYQQQGTYQQGSGTQATTRQAQGQAPASSGQYGTSGDVREPMSRHGSALAILAGALAFLEGLAFVIRAHYYHTLPGYPYRWGLHGWGWTLLILGALLIGGGVAHLLKLPFSRHFAATVAILTAVVAFLTLFYSVVWGIIVIAACGFAAHSLLSRSGVEGRYPADTGNMGYGAPDQSYEYQGTGQGGTGQEAMSGGKRSHF